MSVLAVRFMVIVITTDAVGNYTKGFTQQCFTVFSGPVARVFLECSKAYFSQYTVYVYKLLHLATSLNFSVIMAVKYGTMGEFSFDQYKVFYTKCLIQYFITKSIVEEGEEHKAILLSSCGAPACQLIQNLVAPGKPTDKTISETVTPVRYHHQLTPSTIIQ